MRIAFPLLFTIICLPLTIISGHLPKIVTPEIQTSLQAVYFAQTHIKQPSEDYFFLTSDREVLVKAYVIATNGDTPSVSLEVMSPKFQAGMTNTINLTAPSTIPTSNVNLTFGQVDHTLDNAFTGMIPKEWIKFDTEVKVLLDGVVVHTFSSADLNVMSSNPMRFNMYEIHAFGLGGIQTDMNALATEMQGKFPFSSLDFNHVPNILFPEIAVPPIGNAPAVRISSIAEYQEKTGNSFNSHNTTSKEWRQALRIAQGTWYRYASFNSVGWYYDGGQQTKGDGADYGAAHAKGAKLFWHEVGHGLGLPHLANVGSYPYQGDMHGISRPDLSNVHIGPVWGYYQPTQYPIPPTVQSNRVGGSNTVGNYKQDPMAGGGSGDQESGFLFRHFSDYSAELMARRLQQGGGGIAAPYVVWNPEVTHPDNPTGSYAQWDAATGEYTAPVGADFTNNHAGIEYPLDGEFNKDIYSIMFAISSTYPEANLIYPPIGPYKGGMIQLFDPTEGTSDDAKFFCDFKQGYYNYSGCHYTARVTQGGQVRHYMVRAEDDFDTVAFNVSADDGPVTAVEILSTPAIDNTGVMPTNPTVIAAWMSSNVACSQNEILHNSANIENDTYQAINTITSNATVAQNQNVVYKAGQTITLSAGFQVQAGADFHALIATCNNLQNRSFGERTNETALKKYGFSVFPNPATNFLQINYDLPESGEVTIILYDQAGRIVKRAISAQLQTPGTHELELNISRFRSGVYWLRLQTPQQNLMEKVLILK